MVLLTAALSKYAKCTTNHLKYISSEEVRISVPWGHIAGKWFGPKRTRPILTLHGWMDNCGSMERLIANINKQDRSFLAIDLPGHGHSSQFPLDMIYNYKNYITTIHYLVQHFQWPKVSLMGHSLGSAVAYMYGMIFPNNTDMVISLEMTGIPDIKEELDLKSPNLTYAQLKQHYVKRGVRPELAYYILDRNIAKSQNNPEKFYILTDPRLRSLEYCNIKYAEKIGFPMFIGKTRDGGDWEDLRNFYEVMYANQKFNKDCEFHLVKGNHYAHLNSPEVFGNPMAKFLEKRTRDSDRMWENMNEKITISTHEDKVKEYNLH